MSILKRENLVAFCLLGAILLLVGCGPQYVELPINLSLEQISIDRIPLTAGLYIEKKYSEFALPLYKVDFQTFFVKLGEAFDTGAEEMTRKAFREVIILDGVDQTGIPKGVNVLIIPEIYSFDNDVTSTAYTAEFTVKWTIKDTDGRVLYVNTFVGNGSIETGIGGASAKIRNSWSHAIEDQFNKAFNGIINNKWWESKATF
jgi:hypothetical protein